MSPKSRRNHLLVLGVCTYQWSTLIIRIEFIRLMILTLELDPGHNRLGASAPQGWATSRLWAEPSLQLRASRLTLLLVTLSAYGTLNFLLPY